MFNPTSCAPKSFSGTATSAQGATAPLSSAFQMGSCRSLLFKPDFKVATSGKTSRADGASLDAKIVYPPVPLGANQASGQANIAIVKVELPKQLPSRLTTLQKACTAAQFDANPAGCPAASVIGQVKVVTPVLPVALVGPAYFVSNGGEAFPNLVMVLQGDGVTIDLVGNTFISKAGITSSTFKTVPDVPFTSFELQLPEGPYSALAANGDLCKSKLVDAHRIHRPERRRNPRVHADRRHGLREDEAADPRPEARQSAEGVPQEGEAQAYGVRRAGDEAVRPGQEAQEEVGTGRPVPDAPPPAWDLCGGTGMAIHAVSASRVNGIGFSPRAAIGSPGGGHRFLPAVVAIGSPRWSGVSRALDAA